MKNSTFAYAAAICMAIAAGVACVVLFMTPLLGEITVTGLGTRLLYVVLPTLVLFGCAVGFAQWNAGAARVFAWLSAMIFYVPIVCVVLAVAPQGAEALAFIATGGLSLLAVLRTVSLTHSQR